MEKPIQIPISASEGFLIQAFDALTDGVMVYNANNTIIHANQAFKDFTLAFGVKTRIGMSRHDLIGAFIDTQKWDKDVYSREELISQQINEKKDLNQNEGENISTPDGRYYLRRSRPIPGGGEVITITDVTDIKIAQEQAQAAERSKAEFLANMSHEIRTPLNGILGITELLAESNLDARDSDYVAIIQRSGASLLTIINDVLDFSKIAAGKLTLEQSPFVLHDAIQDVTALLASSAANKDIELLVRVQPDLPKTYLGDVGRFRQIFINLVGNAIKFTSEGHVLVNVKGRQSGDDVHLQINVKDTGIGIPSDQLRHVFDKFTQADSSTTRKYGGTGLGLSIVSSLTEIMGGQIKVTSEVGRGTNFTVSMSLPVSDDMAVKPVAPYDLTGKLFLVIDDNHVNLQILKEQIAAWGAKSLLVDSAAKGLAVLGRAKDKNVKLDGMIVDYQMPEMSGELFAEQVVADGEFKDIPMIMLSSVDKRDLEIRMGKLGVGWFLTKPVRGADLRQIAGQAIETQSQAAKAA